MATKSTWLPAVAGEPNRYSPSSRGFSRVFPVLYPSAAATWRCRSAFRVGLLDSIDRMIVSRADWAWPEAIASPRKATIKNLLRIMMLMFWIRQVIHNGHDEQVEEGGGQQSAQDDFRHRTLDLIARQVSGHGQRDQ